MATLFMLSERLRNADAIPLLSCAGIENLPARFLPRRDATEEDALRQLDARHRRRRAAMESHAPRDGKHMNQGSNP